MKKTRISVYKSLFKPNEIPHEVTIEKIASRIKEGKSKDLIDKIRNGNKDLKKQLPAIVFAGLFNKRNSNGLKTHSGLMCFDFDNYPSKEELEKQREILKQNKHVVLLFTSPSGNGLKAVVKVSKDLNKQTHPQVFKSFNKVFKYDYFDISCSNIDRVCFESYDKDIYTNYDAEIFLAKTFDEGFSYVNRVPLIPINEEEVIIARIMAFDWKKDFREGERNQFVFDLAGAFCEYGVTQSSAIGYISNNVVWGDFTQAETETAIKSAYSIRAFGSKYFENYNKIDIIKRDLKNGKEYVINTHNVKKEVVDKIEADKKVDVFWFTDKKGNVKINPLLYKSFLESEGYSKHYPKGTDKPNFVKVSSNIVEETSVEKIKDFVLNYLLQEKKEIEVWKLCVNFANLFSEQYLLMLKTIELSMLRDTSKESFIAYKNGVLKITQNDCELLDFIDINNYIWINHILPRDFKRTDNNENDYKTFVNNISNNEPTAFECVIGYLLNTYKNKSNNKAIILNDEVISDNPEGGTGKGVFTQGLKEIRRASVLDGKKFDSQNQFSYQTVSLDTQILVLDDVKKNFNFESKFSIVTEGLTIERKNKDAVALGIEKSPKILISTNYVIKGDGNSHNRRRHEIEVGQYYGSNLTPSDEFGRQLFDDWNEEDYVAFDNYMVSCIQLYFKLGLVKQTAKNLKLRKVIAQTSKDFVEWMEEENVVVLDRINKSDFFQRFINDNQDYNNKIFKRNTLNRWVQKYASFKGYDFEQGSSNGVRWFSITDKTKETQLNSIDI